MRSVSLLAALVTALLSSLTAGSALAWDDFGHMEVAAIAYKNLKPSSRKRAIELLKRNPRYQIWIVGAAAADSNNVAFMRAATWADSIKSDPQYTSTQDDQSLPTASQNVGYADKLRHAYWHFIDQPFSPDATPLQNAPAPNAATQIATFRATLGSANANDDLKSYDFTWLLHLVGDVHQPLHCVSRYDSADPKGDRGGNSVKIVGNMQTPICDDPRFCPFGPANELHAFFDDITGQSYCTSKVETAIRAFPAAPPSKAAILDENVWIGEGLVLAQSAVYQPPVGLGDGPFTIDSVYENAALSLGKQQIALAGVRLARVIEDCFAKEAAAKKQKAKQP
jgi:hypothetical protein